MNHEYDEKCLRNFTVMEKVEEFVLKFDKIKSLTRKERKFLRRREFQTTISEICETKREIAKTMTSSIQPLADYCVGEEKIRKQFVLNTLMLLETTLDFVCSMNQEVYEAQSEHCLNDDVQVIRQCQRKSFDLYFWEKIPLKLSLVHLINGAVCK